MGAIGFGGKGGMIGLGNGAGAAAIGAGAVIIGCGAGAIGLTGGVGALIVGVTAAGRGAGGMGGVGAGVIGAGAIGVMGFGMVGGADAGVSIGIAAFGAGAVGVTDAPPCIRETRVFKLTKAALALPLWVITKRSLGSVDPAIFSIIDEKLFLTSSEDRNWSIGILIAPTNPPLCTFIVTRPAV
jgi:hypothetical protein